MQLLDTILARLVATNVIAEDAVALAREDLLAHLTSPESNAVKELNRARKEALQARDLGPLLRDSRVRVKKNALASNDIYMDAGSLGVIYDWWIEDDEDPACGVSVSFRGRHVQATLYGKRILEVLEEAPDDDDEDDDEDDENPTD